MSSTSSKKENVEEEEEEEEEKVGRGGGGGVGVGVGGLVSKIPKTADHVGFILLFFSIEVIAELNVKT
ncbi:hypothetical protein M0804_014328 [Polistes exclamans]|nr:hypothetical protein M0804_014331 [Polistes exclamans]KAI4475419.1 hypothetical protein M0804_014328 [Polistes exclamans]